MGTHSASINLKLSDLSIVIDLAIREIIEVGSSEVSKTYFGLANTFSSSYINGKGIFRKLYGCHLGRWFLAHSSTNDIYPILM